MRVADGRGSSARGMGKPIATARCIVVGYARTGHERWRRWRMGRSHERRHAPEALASDGGLNSSAGMTNEFYQGWAPGMTPGRIAVGRFPSATGGPTGTSMHPGSSDQGDGNWWYVRYDTDVGVAIGCGNVWIRRSRSAAAPQPVVACRGRRTARGKFSVGQRGGAGEQCPLIPSVFRVVVAIPSGANGTAGRTVGHRRAAGTVPDRMYCHPDHGGVE